MATQYATVPLDTVASTQDEALERAKTTGAATLVVAQRQAAGRGRTGRTWLEAPRAMYSSLAFVSSWPAEVRSRLTLVAGLEVRRALHAVIGVAPDLKWPNDLILPAGKIGGILTEAEGDWIVIGCGVNLWWPEPPDGVAAVCAADPGPELGAEIATHWADETLQVAAGDPDRWDHAAYRRACVTLGAVIAWEPNGTGTAVDVDREGALVVDTTQGRQRLRSGEVRTIRPATVAADPAGDEGDSTG